VAADLTTSDLLIVGPTVSPPRYRRRRGLSLTPSLYLSVGAGRRGCCNCAGCYAPRRFPVTRHLAAASTDAAAAAAAVCVMPGIGTVNSQRPRPTNLEFLNCSASTYEPGPNFGLNLRRRSVKGGHNFWFPLYQIGIFFNFREKNKKIILIILIQSYVTSLWIFHRASQTRNVTRGP